MLRQRARTILQELHPSAGCRGYPTASNRAADQNSGSCVLLFYQRGFLTGRLVRRPSVIATCCSAINSDRIHSAVPVVGARRKRSGGYVARLVYTRPPVPGRRN